ncbi:MAG: hypothetical protein ACK5IJ_02340 [Mangrovibacterium sp.]
MAFLFASFPIAQWVAIGHKLKLRSRVSDCSGNPFKGALVLAPLKDWSEKRDGRARECGEEECRHPQVERMFRDLMNESLLGVKILIK